MLEASKLYFNSRPHKEVDNFGGSNEKTDISISTHDLTRRSTDSELFCIIATLFQLTTSQGGRQVILLRYVLFFHFNSRPHKEVDGYRLIPDCYKAVFQLTTSQGGRQISCTCDYLASYISTHDLTRRSTLLIWLLIIYNVISTHDLTRRSTAIFTQKVFLSKSLFVLIAYNTFILY